MKFIFAIILVFAFLSGTGQPGSYRTYININVFDLSLSNDDTTKYTIHFSDTSVKSNIDTLHYKFKQLDSCLTFSSEYRWVGCYPNLQILRTNPNKQTDTMSIKLLFKSQYGNGWFVDSIPYKKGKFVLLNSMFKFDHDRNKETCYITSWERARQEVDKSGNLIIPDYWDWNSGPIKSRKKKIGTNKSQMIQWYKENGAVEKILNYNKGNLEGIQTYYHSNGQLHFYEIFKRGSYSYVD